MTSTATVETERLSAEDERGTSPTGAGVGAASGTFIMGDDVGALVEGADDGALGEKTLVGLPVGSTVAGGSQHTSFPTPLFSWIQDSLPVMYAANAAVSPHVLIKGLRSSGIGWSSSILIPAQNSQKFDGCTSEQQKAEKLMSMFVSASLASHSASAADATSASMSPQLSSRTLSATKTSFGLVMKVAPPGHNEHCAETDSRSTSRIAKSKMEDMDISLY